MGSWKKSPWLLSPCSLHDSDFPRAWRQAGSRDAPRKSTYVWGPVPKSHSGPLLLHAGPGPALSPPSMPPQCQPMPAPGPLYPKRTGSPPSAPSLPRRPASTLPAAPPVASWEDEPSTGPPHSHTARREGLSPHRDLALPTIPFLKGAHMGLPAPGQEQGPTGARSTTCLLQPLPGQRGLPPAHRPGSPAGL